MPGYSQYSLSAFLCWSYNLIPTCKVLIECKVISFAASLPSHTNLTSNCCIFVIYLIINLHVEKYLVKIGNLLKYEQVFVSK